MQSHKILKYSYWLSIICLIHCISFPLLIALLPFLNFIIEINPIFELVLLGSVVLFGGYSLIHAYTTHHKNSLPIILFLIGICVSVYIHFIAHENPYALAFEILAGVFIAGAQFFNLRITPKKCSH